MFCYRDYQLTTRFNQQNEKSTSNYSMVVSQLPLSKILTGEGILGRTIPNVNGGGREGGTTFSLHLVKHSSLSRTTPDPSVLGAGATNQEHI